MEAQADLARVVELDPSLEAAVKKELASLDEKIKAKEKQERARLKGLFSS